MNVATKLVGFLAVVLVIFAGAVGAGRAVGPVGATAPAAHGDMGGGMGGDSHAGMAPGTGGETSTTEFPKGLMVSQDGYTFRLGKTTVSPGHAVPVAFTIEGPDGSPVTAYDVEHDKDLHLIAVRRDFSGFQHVHPKMDSKGTWRVLLDLTAGQWRLFADFKAQHGEALTLGADLAVRGAYRPATPEADSRTSTVDGLTVHLAGDLTAAEETKLTLTVTRGGEPVADLEPYLGAYGHLVALREGDLAYLHVHPQGAPGDGKTKPGPEIVFFTEVPSPGRYHFYLDFKRGGVVRTASFTVTVSDKGTSEPSDTESEGQSHSAGH